MSDTTIKALEEALVYYGVIQDGAIHDAENYDGGQTRLNVFSVWEEVVSPARSRIATMRNALVLIHAGLHGHQHVDANTCAFCKIMRICDEALNAANNRSSVPNPTTKTKQTTSDGWNSECPKVQGLENKQENKR